MIIIISLFNKTLNDKLKLSLRTLVSMILLQFEWIIPWILGIHRIQIIVQAYLFFLGIPGNHHRTVSTLYHITETQLQNRSSFSSAEPIHTRVCRSVVMETIPWFFQQGPVFRFIIERLNK